MKKIYSTPAIIVCQLRPRPILAGSTLDSTETNPQVIVSDNEYHGTFSSRRNNIWDDDE